MYCTFLVPDISNYSPEKQSDGETGTYVHGLMMAMTATINKVVSVADFSDFVAIFQIWIFRGFFTKYSALVKTAYIEIVLRMI